MFILQTFAARGGWLVLLPALASFQAAGGTGSNTQTITATIEAAAALKALQPVVLTHSSNTFQPFQGTLSVGYEVRTTPSGGGQITLQVTKDFAPAGGPAVAAGVLTYTCSGTSGLGTLCSGTQQASTTSATPVLTLPASACTGGGGSCSSQDPNSVNLTFTLTDDPTYSTGSYSATITITITVT